MFGCSHPVFLPRQPHWHLSADSSALTSHHKHTRGHTFYLLIHTHRQVLAGLYHLREGKRFLFVGLEHPALPFQVTFPQELLGFFRWNLICEAFSCFAPVCLHWTSADTTQAGSIKQLRGKTAGIPTVVVSFMREIQLTWIGVSQYLHLFCFVCNISVQVCYQREKCSASLQRAVQSKTWLHRRGDHRWTDSAHLLWRLGIVCVCVCVCVPEVIIIIR